MSPVPLACADLTRNEQQVFRVDRIAAVLLIIAIPLAYLVLPDRRPAMDEAAEVGRVYLKRDGQDIRPGS